jgi:hypothetical protein
MTIGSPKPSGQWVLIVDVRRIEFSRLVGV